MSDLVAVGQQVSGLTRSVRAMSPDHCEGGFPSTAGWLIPPSCCRWEEEERYQAKDGSKREEQNIESCISQMKFQKSRASCAMDQEI